jgi:hypothetical protein
VNPDPPLELCATAVRVGLIITLDLGRPVSGPSFIASAVAGTRAVDRDPRFFDPGLFRPLWQLGTTVDLSVVTRDTTGPDESTPAVFAGAKGSVSTYLHDFGFCAILVVFRLVGKFDTDRMLLAANQLADPTFEVRLDGGGAWSTKIAARAVRAHTAPYFENAGASLQRQYSLIHIVTLDPSVRQGLRRGETVYQRYEREFHALSVRVVRNWRERYPEGSTFPEHNASVAPSGVLRFNARNVLMYEHPYSAAEVESLFYPALVELRLWEIMASVELLGLRAVIAEMDHGGPKSSILSALARGRRASLRIAGEFEALSACTSKRTRQFYNAGTTEFGFDETLRVLRERANQVEGILSRLALGDEVRRERELVSQQRDLAMKAEDAAASSEGVAVMLRWIGLLVTAQLVLDLGGAFKLPAWLVGGLCLASIAVVVVAVMWVQRRHETRGRVRLVREEQLPLGLDLEGIYLRLVALAASREVGDLYQGDAGDIFVSFPYSCAGWRGRARVQIMPESDVPGTEHRVRVELVMTSTEASPPAPVAPPVLELLAQLQITAGDPS